MGQTIEEVEERDGLRLTWNIWPVSQSVNEVIPIAAMYNIYQPTMILPSEPIFCSTCQAILSPQVHIDYGSHSWLCVFCSARNLLPPYARDTTPGSTLPEMLEENSTVEYLLNRHTSFKPIFFFLIDVCTYDSKRHEMMKEGLRTALRCLPDDALVGVIRFGTNFELVSFDQEEIETIYTFSGNMAYGKPEIAELALEDIRNFLVVKEERYDELMGLFDRLEPDPFPVMEGYSPRRCTGSAISFALSFMEGAFSNNPVKYMVFTQGPCTIGPGRVSPLDNSPVTTEKVDYETASQFYIGLAGRINTAGHSMDVISETMADIGIEYFKPLVTSTGGTLIMAQDFDQEIKIGSIERILVKDEEGLLRMGFDVKIQVKTTPNLEFKGFIGEGRPAGAGWRVGSIVPSTNLTLLFENKPGARDGAFGHVQIISQYARSDKRLVTRVTTFCRLFTKDKTKMDMSFDQEAACVLQARAFIAKGFRNVMDFESAIDKHLIKFTRRYGSYEKGNPASVFLPDSMAYFPNFMFFFRRSLLVQRDGISLDENAYFRVLAFKIPVGDAIKMIKPALISFHYQGKAAPVELDTSSLDPESILVLDSFHNILLWKGEYVSGWIKEGLHEQPEYSFFKEAIQQATDYSVSLRDRLPVPQYQTTDEGSSQARILLHYVNPSQQGILASERINYERFYDTLCRFIARND